MESTITINKDCTPELEEIMEQHNVNHLQIGKFFFVPAFERFPNWDILKTWGTGLFPVSFDEREDLPAELKDPKYRSQLIYFWGIGSRENPEKKPSILPDQIAGLLALQDLLYKQEDLGGRIVLDPFCGLGIYSVMAAKIGADVVGIDKSPNNAKRNVELNNMGNRVRFIEVKEDLSEIDFKSLSPIYVLVLHSYALDESSVQTITENLKDCELVISCDPHRDEPTLRKAGYSFITPIHYSRARAIIAQRK